MLCGNCYLGVCRQAWRKAKMHGSSAKVEVTDIDLDEVANVTYIRFIVISVIKTPFVGDGEQTCMICGVQIPKQLSAIAKIAAKNA